MNYLIICYSFTNSRILDYNELLFFKEIKSINNLKIPNIILGLLIFILRFL